MHGDYQNLIKTCLKNLYSLQQRLVYKLLKDFGNQPPEVLGPPLKTSLLPNYIIDLGYLDNSGAVVDLEILRRVSA